MSAEEEPPRADGEREEEEEEGRGRRPTGARPRPMRTTRAALALHSVVAGRKRKARSQRRRRGGWRRRRREFVFVGSLVGLLLFILLHRSGRHASGGTRDSEVDFEFNDTMEIDFHGIKQLLERSAWAVTNISEVADVLVKQAGVGTCVKIDDTYNCVYGIISALNVAEARKNKLSSIDEMCSFLQSVCPMRARRLS